MKPGIYRGIPNDVYHGGPGISKSGLDLIRKSPAHYRAVVTAANDNGERRPTAAQALGTALHMLVLEPSEFARTYTLALTRADVPDAIDDAEALKAMVVEINATRLAKIPSTGTKAELIPRIESACMEHRERDLPVCEPLPENPKGTDLKARIAALNEHRQGLLPTSGSRHDLAELLRANGKPVTLWSDVQAEWMANNGHRQILTAEQFEQLRNMRDAVMAHESASKLLAGAGEAELSAYWMQEVRDPKTGEVIGEQLCRCRPDYWRLDGIIGDLKSTEDASEEEFARSIAKWAYHVQDDYYRTGIAEAIRQGGMRIGDYNPVTGEVTYNDEQPHLFPPKAFLFIAVEKTARVVDGQAMCVGVYSLDLESRQLGRVQWQSDLARFTVCENSNEWPGYASGVRQIKLPAWQFQRAAAAAAAAE